MASCDGYNNAVDEKNLSKSRLETMPIVDLVRDFDPIGVEFDRRLYYEVTGVRLNDGEFIDEDTSDDDF